MLDEAITGESRTQARERNKKRREQTRTTQAPGDQREKPKYGTRSRTSRNLIPNPRSDRDRASNARKAARHAVHVKNEPGRYLPPTKKDVPGAPAKSKKQKQAPPSEKPKYGTGSRDPLNLITNPRTDSDRARNARRRARHAVHVKNEPGRYLPPPEKKDKKKKKKKPSDPGSIYSALAGLG